MIVLALFSQYKWPIFQMDVKPTFLNGYVDEENYVEQLEGFEVPKKEYCVYKLRKALYCLKKTSRSWY